MARRDIRDDKPTRIVMDVSFTVNGGSIVSREMDAVVMAVMRAYSSAAKAQKLDAGRIVSLRSRTPKQFDAWHRRVFKERRDEAQDAAS